MFVAFSTKDCCDKVEIYDGPNATFPKLATLSGRGMANTTYHSNQQSMFFTFCADLTKNNSGISAFYTQLT
uniref:CUB domain-containing protein n=1 Tax=Angiostrongylus cantonensis TaxID=6313 RepID=A0A0K0D9B1_ANGCA